MQFKSSVESMILGQVPSQVVEPLEHLLAPGSVVGAFVGTDPVFVRHVSGERCLEFRFEIAKRALERVVSVDTKMILEVVSILERRVAFHALEDGEIFEK